MALALVAVVAGVVLFGGGVGGGGDIARDPKPDLGGTRSGFDSTVYDGEFLPADPATWAVKVEVADPAPPDLRATIPCPDERARELLALAFADAKAATAAVVYAQSPSSEPLAWCQVALTGAGPATCVPLDWLSKGYGPPAAASQLALSPAGGRLATYGQSRKNGLEFGVVVWNRDGSQLADWVETQSPAGQPECQGVWFASEDRVLIAAKGTLRCREAATGKLVYERPLKLLDGAALSPRRTWLFAGVEGGVEAVATADGASAGKLAVPGISAGGGTRLAVSADGTRLATASLGKARLPLMTWTLADGKPESPTARAIPSFNRIPQIQWCGDRQLLLDGHDVYDFDLGGAVYSLGEHFSVPATGGVSAPDGRAWRVMRPRPDGVAAFKKALPGGGMFYVSAVTTPALPTDGTICAPNTAYRVAAEGVSSHRRVTAEALADGLATRGLRVDPKADLTVHFIGKSISSTRLPYGKVVAPKPDQRLMYPNGLVELVDGFDVTYQFEVRDRQGQAIWGGGGDRSGGTTDVAGEGRVCAWRSAAAGAAYLFPLGPVILRPGANPAALPLYVLARPDGTTEVTAVRD